MSSSARLDVDPTIFENNLRISELSESEEAFNQLFGGENPALLNKKYDENIPWIQVTPSPGICAKFHTTDGDKVFANICLTPDIPAPKDITEAELLEEFSSDEPKFVIPMSIAEAHHEYDKSGNICTVYDIAINTNFLDKIKKEKLLEAFFMTATMEALQEKYKMQFDTSDSKTYVVLRNRKVMGSIPLRAHRVQVRDVRPPPGPLIQEVQKTGAGKELGKTPSGAPDPKLKIERHPPTGQASHLLARVKVRATSEKDIFLDVGEDRLVLTAAKKNLAFVDIFLPFHIDQKNTTAEYSKMEQELRIRMPVVKSI